MTHHYVLGGRRSGRTLALALTLALAALAVSACGRDGASRDPLEPGEDRPAQMRAVAGAGQVAAVSEAAGAELPAAVGVQLYRDKAGRASARIVRRGVSLQVGQGSGAPDTLVQNVTPLPNEILNWRTVEGEACGQPFAASTRTGADGIAYQRWIKGTRAGVCHMVVVNVDQQSGEAIVYDTVAATFEPGPVHLLIHTPTLTAEAVAGQPYRLGAAVLDAQDGYGNRLSREQLAARMKYAIDDPSAQQPMPADFRITIPADLAPGAHALYLTTGSDAPNSGALYTLNVRAQ